MSKLDFKTAQAAYLKLSNIRAREPYVSHDAVIKFLDNFKVPYKLHEVSFKENALVNLVSDSSFRTLIEINPNVKLSVPTLIGKGVVYDTGGLNLKTRMLDDMVFDKTGAMLSVVVAALYGLPALVTFVDNCVTNIGYYPGQIVTSKYGLKVFIKDTDAEGRIVLAGLLDEIPVSVPAITIATLTGAAHSFMGNGNGVLAHTNNLNLQKKLLEDFHKGKSLLFPAPVHSCYKNIMNTTIKGADITNLNYTAQAGSQQGYEFLTHFHDRNRLVHLDIAAMMCDRHHNALGWGIKDIKRLVDHMQ